MLAHERCHVRHHDNLAAAVHMAVEAIFWFHPLVWWIERRMIDERERACDEAVLGAGSRPADYAEGILAVCRWSLRSPVMCVSGVTGSDLRRRVESIMRHELGRPMTIGRRLALGSLAVAALAGPIAAGAVNAQIPSADVPAFEVAAIRRNTSGEPNLTARVEPGGRLNFINMPLRQLIVRAFQVQAHQLVGGPDWLDTDRFDIIAKAPDGTPTTQYTLMLRALLLERFTLAVHRETRDMQVYALVSARSDGRLGPQLRPAAAECPPSGVTPPAAARGAPPGTLAPPNVGACRMQFGIGRIIARGMPVRELERVLSAQLGSPVLDKTGITGNYDFTLEWQPDPGMMRQAGAAEPPPAGANAPSLFTALQEQLGLRLESQRAPIEVIVIDRVEIPSAN